MTSAFSDFTDIFVVCTFARNKIEHSTRFEDKIGPVFSLASSKRNVTTY